MQSIACRSANPAGHRGAAATLAAPARHRRLLCRSLPATLTTLEVAIFAPNARLGLHSDSLREPGLRCRPARVRAGRPWTGYLHPAVQAVVPCGIQRSPQPGPRAGVELHAYWDAFLRCTAGRRDRALFQSGVRSGICVLAVAGNGWLYERRDPAHYRTTVERLPGTAFRASHLES